jgi:hypothetical protein
VKGRRAGGAGFTVTEIVVASSILVIAVMLAMRGLMYVMRGSSLREVQNNLDVDVQASMERLKRDIRLTSLDKMVYFPPGAGPYTAVSFPLARDDDRDGVVDVDTNGAIVWDRTLVYHVWAGVPYELRLTTFDPRDNTLGVTQRQAQITSVVTNGHGRNTYEGAHTITTVVFANLFNWSLSPSAARFDGYDASLTREVDASLGSCVLSNGLHTFTFTVIDRNTSSTNYRVGLDSLMVSPCGNWREAEEQSVTATSGVSATRRLMDAGSWDNNHDLYFPAATTGRFFTLTMANDRWEETNFRETGQTHSNTFATFDRTLCPSNYVVALTGLGTNWTADGQAGTNAVDAESDLLRGAAVRVLLRGADMVSGGWIPYNAGKCRVQFCGSTEAGQTLRIRKAYIGECADSLEPTPNVVSNVALTFGGGDEATAGMGSNAWSDTANLAISKDKSYLVSFLVRSDAGAGSPSRWDDSRYTNAVGSYVIPTPSGPDLALLAQTVWSNRTDVQATNALFAVGTITTLYPPRGVFDSQVIDTGLDAPVFTTASWNCQSNGGRVLLQVRTAVTNDMSDAADWTNTNTVPFMSSGGAINPGAKRYAQFRATLFPDNTATNTPKLRDVTVAWNGKTRLVDIMGTFTKGPDYGVVEMSVDGQRIISALTIDLEIFKAVRGYGPVQTNKSRLVSEVSPRNSGK